MDLDFDDAVQRAIREYARLVTAELGLSGECSSVQAERPASAYLAVDGHLPGFPDRDVALLWDERRGWAAAVETDSGHDLVLQARLEGDVLPPPAVVASWVRSLLSGDRVGAPAPASRRAGDVPRRLKTYAASASVPLPRTA